MAGDEPRPFLFRVQSTFVPAGLVVSALILGFTGRSILQSERDATKASIEAVTTSTAAALKEWQLQQDARERQYREQQDKQNLDFQSSVLLQISQMRGEQSAVQASVSRVEQTLAVLTATQSQLAFTADLRLWAADIARENPTMKIPPFVPTAQSNEKR